MLLCVLLSCKIPLVSDFIIGYPGETDNDFLLSCELLKKIKFINVYSYIFSPRPGTPADNLDLIDHLTAKNRLYIFQNIASEIKENYKKDLINIKTKTLFENEISKNKYFGRDEYMNPVVVESKIDIVGIDFDDREDITPIWDLGHWRAPFIREPVSVLIKKLERA